MQRDPLERWGFAEFREVAWLGAVLDVQPFPLLSIAPSVCSQDSCVDQAAALALEDELAETYAALNSLGVSSAALQGDSEASDIRDFMGAVFRKARRDVQVRLCCMSGF